MAELKLVKRNDGPPPAEKTLDGASLVGRIYDAEGADLLNLVMNSPDPETAVRELAAQDYYWLVRRIGEDDALPILGMADDEQLRYLLDIELWRRDRIDEAETTAWLERLLGVDPTRLAEWLMDEGRGEITHFFLGNTDVAIHEGDDAADFPDGFFTLDGLFYIRAKDSALDDTVRRLARAMAEVDQDWFLGFLQELAVAFPVEVEEEMYRQRSIRMAEHGFLPFEEALEVYAPLAPEQLSRGAAVEAPGFLVNEDSSPAPFSPLVQAGGDHLLSRALAEVEDPLLAGRLMGEFAALVNQVLTADASSVDDMDVVQAAARKAAGYVNIALERVSEEAPGEVEDYLRSNTLLSVFRVGFGQAMKIKWETERWIAESWFGRQGFGPDFWGERWAGVINGLLRRGPKYFEEPGASEEYRDFRTLSDLAETMKTILTLMVLDRAIERLVSEYSFDPDEIGVVEELTWRHLVLTSHARRILGEEPGPLPLGFNRARDFFKFIRNGREDPPFDLSVSEDELIRSFSNTPGTEDPRAASMLKEALTGLWRDFQDEYSRVKTTDLDFRVSRFLLVGM